MLKFAYGWFDFVFTIVTICYYFCSICILLMNSCLVTTGMLNNTKVRLLKKWMNKKRIFWLVSQLILLKT